MTDLVDEVKASFETAQEDVGVGGGVTMVSGSGDELAPGFMAMREHYEQTLLMIVRRAYRYYAGREMPTDGDELLVLTAEKMTAPLIATSLGAFANGVMIGHRSEHMVRMCFHFNSVEHLFHDDAFKDASLRMAHGFAEDRAVTMYFHEYVEGALSHMAHITGFAHSEVNPVKVWDLWILSATACVTASYLAGNRMGASWRERDVLDGIEIASESAGQDGTDLNADEGDQGELGGDGAGEHSTSRSTCTSGVVTIWPSWSSVALERDIGLQAGQVGAWDSERPRCR